MATSGPVCTEVDSPVAESRNPTPAKLISASDTHGFRPVGATTGQVGVESAMSLAHSRPSSGLPNQAHPTVPHQPTPVQQHLQQGATGQSLGHFPVSNSVPLQAQHSPHSSSQQRTPQQILVVGGNPRQQQPAQIIQGGNSIKISRPQSHTSRRTSQDGQMDNRAHPVVTRPVANMGQLQGGPAAMVGGQMGKTQMLQQRSQGSPQDKSALAQKLNSAQRQGIQRVHPRNPGWQPPSIGQHAPGTPSGQSRLFYQHPVLNSLTRTSPQEHGRQQVAAVATAPQQLAQQQQMRDAGSTGAKSMPAQPVSRTPVTSNHTSNHVDTAYRERPTDSPIVVHIADRKVKLSSETDPSSLYSLCRRWVRNDVPRIDRPAQYDIMNIPLPRPLSAAEVESAANHALENGTKSNADECAPELEKPVDLLTDEELLQSHIQHFKIVRKRSREERVRRIARFKPRLALLLPGNNESS